jgi:hypothetical protein
MKRTFVGIFTASLFGVALVAAQPATPSPQASADKGKVYVGCLVPGPSAGTYALISATEKGSKDKTKLSFIIIPAQGAKVNLDAQLTHEVELTGNPADTGSGVPTVNATKVKWRADFCG